MGTPQPQVWTSVFCTESVQRKADNMAKDPNTGFRAFADFIQTCYEAMPHIECLNILNDYEENQKLVQKLPNWATARWNRQAT